MGGHKSISSSSDARPVVIPPPPIPDYIVTGTLTPNATGSYFYAGIYEGKPYYRRTDGLWFLWWLPGPNFWILSSGLDEYPETGYWHKGDPITGIYAPNAAATGNATVSAGV